MSNWTACLNKDSMLIYTDGELRHSTSMDTNVSKVKFLRESAIELFTIAKNYLECDLDDVQLDDKAALSLIKCVSDCSAQLERALNFEMLENKEHTMTSIKKEIDILCQTRKEYNETIERKLKELISALKKFDANVQVS